MTYQAANDCSQIENSPEPTEVLSLRAFMGIGDHNSPLSGPQQTCTDTEEGTRKDGETKLGGVERNE